MSAPALRRPARVWPVLRDDLRLWFRMRVVLGCVLGGTIAVASTMMSASDDFVGWLATSLAIQPLAESSSPQDERDATMPLDRARFDLVRVAGATLGAGFTLAIAIGVHAALYWIVGPRHESWHLMEYPSWYPLVLFAVGLAYYLIGRAVLLCLRSWRSLAFFLYVVVMGFVSVLLWESGLPLRLTAVRENPMEAGRMGVLEVLGGTLLPIAFACAAVYAAARFPSHAAFAPAPDRRAGRGREATRREHPREPVHALRRTSGPRRRAATIVVAWRQFALLGHKFRGWAVFLGLSSLLATILEISGGSILTAPGLPFVLLVMGGMIAWPVIAWMEEIGVQGEWNDALPVGMVTWRVLHAAAGAAWLLLALPVFLAGPLTVAVATGRLASPADLPVWLWGALPCVAAAHHLASTSVLVSAGEGASTWSVLAAYVGYIGIFLTPWGAHLATGTVLAPFAWGREPSEWSPAAGVLWLALWTAAAVAAIAWSVRSDRRGTRRLRERVRSPAAGRRPAARAGRAA